MILTPYPRSPYWASATTAQVLDAAGESVTYIGKMYLEGGAGSKVISSAGGKIHWRTSAITFANAGTTLRVGIQDVGATGIEDGTFDVHKDLVGATDTIAANSLIATVMATGSKTISHGDVVAISFEVISRGGADSIQVDRGSVTGQNFPYVTIDTGSGPAKNSNGAPTVTVEFDDGTVGWLGPEWLVPAAITSVAFNSGSTPDERAMIFQLPGRVSFCGAAVNLTSVSSTDTFEAILYSDPEGSPVALETITVNPNLFAVSINVGFVHIPFTPITLAANTKYAIAIRPTSANSINFQQWEYGSGNEKLLRPTMLGENWYLGTRSDQTGAFSPTTTTIPAINLNFDKIDDGAGTKYIIGG